MKKYLMILAMVFCMGSLLTGCGSKEKEKTEEQKADSAETEELVAPSLDKVDLDKVVTLGEYKGIEVEKEVSEVTDEAVQSEISYMLSSYPEEITEGVAETGDQVDIAMVGTIDGEEFEGGSSESYAVTIGAGANIEGFEEGLVGTTVGQNLDLNLKFPDDYSEELGGKDVVFNVTINSIKRPLTEPTDEWVAANTDYKTVDECKEGIRSELEKSNAETADENVKSTAWQQVVESSTINEYPKEVEEYGIAVYKSQFESYAEYAGITMEDYLESQGITQEDFDEQSKSYGQTVASQVLVANAIAKKEKLEAGDDEYKAMLQEYLDANGVTEEEFFEQYPKANVDQSILLDRIQALIMDNAKIKEVKAEDNAEAEDAALSEDAGADETAEDEAEAE